MGRNLGPLNIKDSYEGLVQISGSQLTDGSGSLISNLEVTASHATTADSVISASYAQTSTSASHALVADLATTASYVENVVSASYALTSTSASHADNSDSSLTAISASYAVTASYAENAGSSTLEEVLTAGNTATNNIILTGSYQRVSGSFSGSVIDNITDTYTSTTAVQHVISLTQAEYNAIVTKDPSTFYLITDSEATMITGSVSGDTLTFSKSDGSTFPLTITSVSSSISSSYAVSSSHSDISDTSLTAISSSYSTFSETAVSASFATTASYVESVVSASYALTSTSASHANSSDTAISASYAVISDTSISSSYSTFSETSVSSSYALTSTSASHANSSDTAISASYAVTASYAENVGAAFPYTGSAQITGSLGVTGSVVGNVGTLTDVAGTTTMDCSLGNFFTLAMPAGGSTTLTPSNIQAGQTINVKITQNATPSTIAFDASVDFEGGTAFAVSTGAGEVDVMTFISFDGTSLQATGLKNFS